MPSTSACCSPPCSSSSLAAGTCGLALSLIGLVWYFGSPPLGAKRIAGPPAGSSNDPAASVYFGYGCFWHSQYDMWRVERHALNRTLGQTTSLVGYAGGNYESADGESSAFQLALDSSSREFGCPRRQGVLPRIAVLEL